MEYAETGLLVVLIVISAVCSGTETALTSLKRSNLKYIEKENPKIAELLKLWLKKPNEMIATILIINNLVNIFASSVATMMASKIIQNINGGNAAFAVIISTLTMTVVLLVFGEITPKIIARNNSEKISKIMILPIYYLSMLMFPLVWFFTELSIVISGILGMKVKRDNCLITEEEIKSFVEVGEQEGVIEAEEKKMIHSIFDFGESTVKDVMVPRTDVFSIEASSTVHEVWGSIVEMGYSRIPVYENTIDNIIGIAYMKDLIAGISKKENSKQPIRNFLREVYFVPETKLLVELLKEFKTKKIHLAVVLDEYGGTAGIVTIEDLLEEIVGEINDEYDEEEEKIRKISDNEYIVNPIVDIETLNLEINLGIPESEDYDTLSGFLHYELGKIPEKGDKVYVGNFILEVVSLQGNRVKEVKIMEGKVS